MPRTATRKRTDATRPPRFRNDRPRDWIGPLVTREKVRNEVFVQGMQGDESLRPADSPILWTVDVGIASTSRMGSVYLEEDQPEFADPDDSVQVHITFGYARGRDEVEPVAHDIECSIAHLDTLAETLTAAIMLARREGRLPVAKGIKPWTAEIGKRNAKA